jgi:Concanavalin A-like lectin/glucanases superfamily
MSESNTPSSPTGRFDLLAQKYLDHDLTEDEAGEMLDLVKADPGAGTRVLDQLTVHELLREAARAEQVMPLSRESPVSRSGKQWPAWLAVSVAAAAMIALMINLNRSPQETHRGNLIPAPQAQSAPPQAEQMTRAVAVLGEAFNAVWESGSPTAGSPLNPGVLELRSGMARIDFFSGARVLLTGPCVFELVSMDRAICHRGKLTAEVPVQARGFVIATPDGTVRDLGTATGLDVGPKGAAVHVFSGEVEIDDGGPQQFRSGEGVRLVGGRATERFAASAGDFTLSADAIAERRGALARRVDEWAALGKARNDDPHLLARFDFEGITSPVFQLRNTASQRLVADGSIINCPVVEGRWPGKGALQFRSLSDRVRLMVPGEFHSLSYTAWISVHSLPNRYNSLLMTEGFEYGQVHWQIVEDGSLRLGFCADPSENRRPSDYDSPPLLGPEMFGQWLHVAAVVDGDGKRVSHYLNGELVAEHQAEDLLPLSLGTVCIGNWTEPYGEVLIRNFSGIIDELTIHDRVLNATEVHAMFAAGSPSSLPAGE